MSQIEKPFNMFWRLEDRLLNFFPLPMNDSDLGATRFKEDLSAL